MTSLLTIAALAIDWIIGDPQGWPHPVRLIGRLIDRLERLARDAVAGLRPADPQGGAPRAELLAGTLLGLIVVVASGLGAWALLRLLGSLSPYLWLAAALYLAYSAICLKDLLVHVGNVERALAAGDLDEARRALSWMVGRDTASLDPEGIRRALVETMAENFSDGLAAPLFYLAIGGPVLAWAYKAVNTLDSMVGYKNERYLFLGRFSARLDDVANYVPSRLAALILVAAARLLGLDCLGAWRLWRTEGRFHTSPNSGQTEATMAGALGVRLGGPSSYGGVTVSKPVIGQGGVPASAEAVRSAGRLVVAGTLLAGAMAAAVQLAVLHLAGAAPGWGLAG